MTAAAVLLAPYPPADAGTPVSAAATAPPPATIPPQTRLTELRIAHNPDGAPRFILNGHTFTARQLARALEAPAPPRAAAPPLFRLLNIASPTGIAWVGLGLLGQALFTGRMLVQWLVSERARRSVVPPAFWWLSLGGATMLLVYFAWRKDIVGLLGQGTGFLIYARNLWLLRSAPPIPFEPPHADPPSA